MSAARSTKPPSWQRIARERLQALPSLGTDFKEIPDDWRGWLEGLFPDYVSLGFAPHHERFWKWVWAIDADSDPAPFVGVWPRGGAKSSSIELAFAALGMRKKRHYGLYVRGTQDRADDSVGNIAALLEEGGEGRSLNRYGQSKGWRRNRIRTSSGFTVDAIGLDVAGRGVKLENMRPDVIAFDDIDERHDGPRQTEKKIITITDSLLPAGTTNAAVMAAQNLIIPNGVFSRLTDGRADFLSRRIVSGPHPAVRNLRTEKISKSGGEPSVDGSAYKISEGVPTWAGQDLKACTRLINRMGLAAFLRECQHQVKEREGAIWRGDLINEFRLEADLTPPLKRVVVGVDPSGGADEIGIIGGGRGYDNHLYTIEDRSQPGSLGPHNWARHAVEMYHYLQADAIVAERNFGGDMVLHTIRTVDPNVKVKLVSASRGKAVRAEPVASLMEEGRDHHVGVLEELETEMTSWVPGDPDSPNRLDAKVWMATDLMLTGGRGGAAGRKGLQGRFRGY